MRIVKAKASSNVELRWFGHVTMYCFQRNCSVFCLGAFLMPHNLASFSLKNFSQELLVTPIVRSGFRLQTTGINIAE